MLPSEFLTALMTVKHKLSAAKANSTALQGPSLDLPQSINHIRNLRQPERRDEGSGLCKKIYSDAAKLCNVEMEGRRGRPPIASSAFDQV